MKRLFPFVLLFLFVVVLVFSFALSSSAAGGPAKCCAYVNACGHIGEGRIVNGHCTCWTPTGTGMWYEGCWHMCPALCL
jgi:hypothetical protein